MTAPMTPEQELQKAEKAFRLSSARTDEARKRRNAAVRDALDSGMTHAAVAKTLDVSRGRVSQLAR